MKRSPLMACCVLALATCSTGRHGADATPATVMASPAPSTGKIVVVTPDGATAPLGPAHTMNAMLQAIATNDRAAFLHDAEPAVKTALTPPVFAQVTANYGARLRSEYRVTYFGSMKKQGYDVYLWKLAFASGGDDLLVEMSVKNGLVGGFWFM